MEHSKEYNAINQALQSMKEEYKIMPNKFLLKKIELAEKKLNQINANVAISTNSKANYGQGSDNEFDQEQRGWTPK